MTLHNHRLSCVNGILFREGRVCEDCVGRRLAWPGVVHACYQGSRARSAGVAAMLAFHRRAGSWHRGLDAAIAISAFARSRVDTGSIPAEIVHVKPNFLLEDPGPNLGERQPFLLFVGRLVPEKGLRTLLDAWRSIPGPVGLRIIRDGPLAGEVAERARADPRIAWLGRKPLGATLDRMRQARAVIEAFATGTPVIAARIGALFAPGDAAALARAVAVLESDAAGRARLQRGARAAFEARYTAEANHAMLMEVYRTALARAAA